MNHQGIIGGPRQVDRLSLSLLARAIASGQVLVAHDPPLRKIELSAEPFDFPEHIDLPYKHRGKKRGRHPGAFGGVRKRY
jgi:hypothetical protein